MNFREPLFRKIAKSAIGASLAFCLFIFLAPSLASAQTKLPNSPAYPCPPYTQCRFYEEMDKVLSSTEGVIIMALVMAALNALTFMTQQLAEVTAQFILHGGKGGFAQYYTKSFSGFLEDVGTSAANSFITDINNYVKQATGFNICAPFGLQALDIQLSLGLQKKLWPQKVINCSFKQFTDNFAASVQTLENIDSLNFVKTNFRSDRSDIGIAVTYQQRSLLREQAALNAETLNRLEGRGIKPIADLITGNIRTPAQEVQNTLAETNRVKLNNDISKLTVGTIAGNAFKIGVYQLPAVFGATLLNTLAVAGLTALKDALLRNPGTEELNKAQLLNPFAQGSAEATRKRAVAFNDIVTPNLLTTDSQDFVHELSSCPTPRGLWGCAMDDTFAAGLRAFDQNGAFSVARAMGIGTDGKGFVFLHPDWELIPESETKDNQDPGCYQRAYCASNLAKLRFARILPIGWELAANSPFNTKKSGRYVTLGEVVRGFNDCSDKNPVADKDHPWCHLIDPSWVLSAPQFKCQIKGFGDTVFAGQFPLRLQECSDVISCLTRDDKGQCVGGYGYCLSEKTVWRFSADACLERFVSCRTYQRRNTQQVLGGAVPADAFGGESVSYIRNTIDYGSCNADNIGCTYYSIVRDTATTSTDRWLGKITPAVAASGGKPATGPTIDGPRVYFDATMESCPAGSDGCTKLLKIQEGVPSLNLIKNGSFELTRTEGSTTKFDTWFDRSSSVTHPAIGSVALAGVNSADFKTFGDVYQMVSIAPLRSYVLSFYARIPDGASPTFTQAFMQLYKSDGKTFVTTKGFYRNKTTCSSKTSDAIIFIDAKGLDSTWKRYTCEFVSNTDAAMASIDLNFGGGVQIDAVQLEEADRATGFVDGENTGLVTDHLRLPPEELVCTGDAKKDRTECSKYARMCKQTEAGCQGYTDVGGSDTTEIPATLSVNDLCPAECVGYAEYRKLPSAFDLVKNAVEPLLDDSKDDSIAYFVPSRADQCTVQNVGCEEFTNIEAAAAGGEQKSTFSYIRACQKPDDDSTTYFTWEGSETTGYQLRTWSLVRDKTLSPSPPKILLKAGPEGFIKKSELCTETAWKSGADPDCRQFYDEKGNVFYRYFSQTIVSSPDCRNYRKNNSNFDDCTKTGGAFDATANECVYAILASQSLTCPTAASGCRGYIGTTGRNAATIYTEAFSGTTVPGAFRAPSGVELTSSAEALTVGDHSLKVARGSGGPTTLSMSVGYTSVTGSLYTLSFWTKTTDTSRPSVAVTVDGKVVGTFVPLTDWSRFEIGPFTADKIPSSTIEWRNVSHVTFFDEIAIRRQQDVVYVKKDSWRVPASCDQTSAGIPQPQAMLGCRAYRDRNGTEQNIREFSRLCRAESIGCTAYVDTRNSADPYAQSFVLPGYDPAKLTKPWDSFYSGTVTVTRSADRFVYAIDEPSVHCDASMASCRAFGRPKLSADWSLATSTPFETIYLKDDITKYTDESGEPKMLCRPSELFCERYGSQTPSGPVTSYFRNPGDHACEWRDRIALPAGPTYPKGEYSGWFVKGAEPAVPCYPEKLASGSSFLSEYSAALGYRGWTGICPEAQAECTEFRDPNDNTDASHPQGRPYFFINNQKIDKQTCNGLVDLLSGCVLFRDMTDSQLPFSTIATYAKSNAENGNAQTPINCVTDPTNLLCKGRCGEFQRACASESGCEDSVDFVKKHTSAACSTDAECSIHEEGDPTFRGDDYDVMGKCLKNDSNTVIKVKLDRDCSTWLGCSSGETVYDTAQGKYVDLCTNLAVCDQSLGPNGKQFCAHYLDRVSTASTSTVQAASYESLLREGTFVSAGSYSKRPTGFGRSDYSGYVLPNHFQISDYVTRRVGYELLANRSGAIRDQYYGDYRIVARSPLYIGLRNTAGGVDDLSGLSKDALAAQSPYGAVRFTDLKYPYLRLCQHKQTKQIGYYLADRQAIDSYAPVEKPAYCYFAIDVPYTQNPADLGGDGSTNPRNVQNLSVLLEQSADVKLDTQLTRAFPAPECKAHPDASSPFPNHYVKEWDLVSDPPKPKQYANGYENVAHCEYGEDCTCTYRKVSYGSRVKYYSPYGPTPPTGICVGGTRDGQGCVPDSEIASGTPTSTSGLAKPDAGNSTTFTDTCGKGGTCQAIDSVNLIRGIFGQCLQRDGSRRLAGSQDFSACLVWNPTPLLFGKNDVYHYQPTAGYVPPSNSGEYYCVASALPPKSVQPLPLSATWLRSPGQMEDHKFHFDDGFVSDKSCVDILGIGGCNGNDAYFLDGAKAAGGTMGEWCEETDDDQDDGGRGSDGMAARWVTTGRGSAHNYAEYFIGLKPAAWSSWLTGRTGCSSDDPSSCDQAALDSMLERNFSYFSFSPITNPNGNGRLGCGYSEVWVDGSGDVNYNKNSSVRDKDKVWLQGFNSQFGKILSSQSQDYLRTEDGSKLAKVPCFYSVDNPDGTGCYYKYWQLGYRDEGEEKFKMQWEERGGPRTFGKNSVYYGESQASKSFFSIRAMFEDTNPADNKRDQDDQPVNGNKLTGPFRFVGWWVTASAPGTDTEHAIYMYMTIGHAEICKEVAQVIAPDTREATAFQDRMWQPSAYTIPGLGYVYSSTNEPFGSAKHTRPIGLDPLFQVRGPVPGVRSKLKPPTFIAAGLEYARGGQTPTANWAWLTNLFARVYRVYRYYDQPVTKESWACIYGPRFGTWCPDLSSSTSFIEGKPISYTSGAQDISRKYCGYAGTCTGAVDVTKSIGLCNSLSGVNAGLTCSGDTGYQISGYHVCHNAPVRDSGGDLQPLYKPCVLEPGWKKTGSSYYKLPDESTEYTQKTADALGAFRCQKGSVTNPSDGLPVICHKPTKFKSTDSDVPSTDCPAQVLAGSDKGDGFIYSQCVSGRCNNGFEHAACNADADCQFTFAQWWGGPNADQPKGPTGKTSDGGTEILTGYGSTAQAVIWWSKNTAFGQFKSIQFNPGTGDAKYAEVVASGKASPEAYKDIGGKEFSGANYVKVTDAKRIQRFPGAYVANVGVFEDEYIPSHCERAPEPESYIKYFIDTLCTGATKDDCAWYADRPYAEKTFFDSKKEKFVSATTRYYGDSSRPWKQAICEGGSLEGRACSSDAECIPNDSAITKLQEDAGYYCQPTTTPYPTVFGAGAPNQNTLSGRFSFSCVDPKGDPKSTSLDTDDNICTHNAGYYPRVDLCGNDPTRPECLTSVTQNNATSLDPTKSQPPTDVTPGLYTPKYLATKVRTEYGTSAAPDPLSFKESAYKYISYYTPRPPTIAAPDTSRQCPSSGSCPIAKVNGFTFENQTEGTVTAVGGQVIGTMRFYGWTADNQAPLKDMWVDWGDGISQEVHDARIKNKKPFCGGTRECQFVPGLTCNTDSDCPPAGGKCAEVGYCKTKPNVQCATDEDCSGTSVVKDRCVIRTTFGNSAQDCEQNYFEFTHAFACGSDARRTLPDCGTTKRCSRNNAVTCGTDADCGTADKCIASLAPPGGCFDRTKVACRYTPRVLLKDNWGWCTGECRVQAISGKLAGGFKSSTKSGAANSILLNNGGCYDGSRTYLNTDTKSPFVADTGFSGSSDANMCDPRSTDASHSPWVIYQGALQLGILQ